MSEIPGIGLAIGLSSANAKSSEKTIEVYQPWYVADKGGYGITKKTTEHTYKVIRNPIALLPGGKNFLSEEGKISEVAEGPRGYRKTTPTNDAPDIEILHQKGEGKVTVRSENVTEELSIKEESEAFLYLYSKIAGNQLKELVKEMPVALAKEAADYGVAIIPGGFIINKIGITGAITDKMEKVITRYPTYLVPLSVQVFELIPNPSPSYAVWELEEKPVPCGAITVAKKKLDSNCRVALQMDKKHIVKNITPEVKIPYYRYEIALAGPITQARAYTSPLAAMFYSLIGRPLQSATDEEIVLDEDGFVVVPWWDIEDLPLTPPIQSNLDSPHCGDANGDGRVTTLDIALIRKHILGLGSLNTDSIERTDINRDGNVSTLDIALLRRKILGDGSFPFSCSAVAFDLDASSFEELDTNSQQPSSNLNDITADSIFDTVSVNLKVNGSDGPVAVSPRSRIVLSWISEGATRCRANWSKNDIKLSGTAAGRISRTSTIKVACIDAERHRADDEVVVNVVE